MNTRRFVSGSSVLLAGWLGATFLNDVPAQRYPKLDRSTAKTSPTPRAPQADPMTVTVDEMPASAAR